MIKMWYAVKPDPDVVAFLDATGITDAVIEVAIDHLVRGLKSADLWTKVRALYPMVGGTSNTCKYNLKDPRDLDAAYRLTFVNAPTIDGDGVAWNGTNQYANTHFIPSTSGLTDMHIGYYSLTNTLTQNRVEIGGRTASNPYVWLSVNAGSAGFLSFVNIIGSTGADALTASKIVENSTGMYVGSRESGDFRLHRNGTQIGSKTPSLAALSTITTPMALGVALTNNVPTAGTYSVMKCGLAAIGEGLTAAEAVTYSGILNHFCEHMGRNTY